MRNDLSYNYGASNEISTEAALSSLYGVQIKTAEFDIMFGEGISRDGEIIDYGVKLDIIDKSGAWFSYKAAKIGQGRENAKAYLKEHSEISDEIVAAIKNSIGLDKLISGSGGKDEDGESIEENTEE